MQIPEIDMDSVPDEIKPYPEHLRMATVAEATQAIGEFLDSEWMEERGLTLAQRVNCEDYHENGETCALGSHLMEHRQPLDKMLADYAGIDLKKIEAEKKAMIKAMEEANE